MTSNLPPESVAPHLTARAHEKKARRDPATPDQLREIAELRAQVGEAVYQDRLAFLEADEESLNQQTADTLANYLRMNIPLKETKNAG